MGKKSLKENKKIKENEGTNQTGGGARFRLQ
jgi:hypothetical protein